jgi:DNA-directed RNA polymerase subunit N (RpoN/RPB10)
MNCGNPIADKWRYFQRRVKELKGEPATAKSTPTTPIYIDGTSVPVTKEDKVFEELGIERKQICCRKHFLTHVDLIDKI